MSDFDEEFWEGYNQARIESDNKAFLEDLHQEELDKTQEFMEMGLANF